MADGDVRKFDSGRTKKKIRRPAPKMVMRPIESVLEEFATSLHASNKTLLEVGHNTVVVFEGVKELGTSLDAHSEALLEISRRTCEIEHAIGVMQSDLDAICNALGLPQRYP